VCRVKNVSVIDGGVMDEPTQTDASVRQHHKDWVTLLPGPLHCFINAGPQHNI
jgi:hypothetical protein